MQSRQWLALQRSPPRQEVLRHPQCLEVLLVLLVLLVPLALVLEPQVQPQVELLEPQQVGLRLLLEEGLKQE